MFVNLAMDYMPETLKSVQAHYKANNELVPIFLTKLYTFQMLRGLAYLHGKGICHWDIKPANLLIDPAKQHLKYADFGTAKFLVVGEDNVSYVCQWFYRAPELVFGSTQYTYSIDIWSVGCILAELLNGEPLFTGETGLDQLVEIFKVLGTPSKR